MIISNKFSYLTNIQIDLGENSPNIFYTDIEEAISFFKKQVLKNHKDFSKPIIEKYNAVFHLLKRAVSLDASHVCFIQTFKNVLTIEVSFNELDKQINYNTYLTGVQNRVKF